MSKKKAMNKDNRENKSHKRDNEKLNKKTVHKPVDLQKKNWSEEDVATFLRSQNKSKKRSSVRISE